MRFLMTLAFLGACTDPSNPDNPDDEELLTTVLLEFSPSGGGDPVLARWADVELDADPEITDAQLTASTDYELSISFLDETGDPVEDITEEVRDEAEQHQVFVTGNVVDGPATTDRPDAPVSHTYNDADANGLPVGLDNLITTRATGSGAMTITLRHMPNQGGEPQKTAGLAEEVATSGFGTLPGSNDVQVTIDVSVD